MKQEVRVGLIGAGKHGIAHLRGMSGCTGMRVVGVADPHADVERLREFVGPDCLIVGTVKELLDKAKPDVVHIVTPPASHTAIAREALLAGVNIYVEKPFTLTTSDALELFQLAKERGLKICAGHQCLYQTSATYARERLPLYGRIVHVESYFSFHTIRHSIDPVDQAKDILPHAVYMLVDALRAARPAATGKIELHHATVGADGEIYGILELDGCRGILIVTLHGRPVEQYLRISGTGGSLHVDLVTDSVVEIRGPGTSGVAALLHPYRESWQNFTRSTRGLWHRIRNRKYGYLGLRELAQAFYDSVRDGTPSPISTQSIEDTVDICDRIGQLLEPKRVEREALAKSALAAAEAALPALVPGRAPVVVTGASGFLGRAVVRELRAAGYPVRALVRQPLRNSGREPGIEYVVADLARGIPAAALAGVDTVVHAAAETRGGKSDHERNSIAATAAVVDSMAAAGVKQLVHVSSVAVMTPSSRALDETSHVDYDSLKQGPYAWGKARSEQVAVEAAKKGVTARILRLGPLVDFAEFDPPGRLGREAGPFYVAIGPKSGHIALCDVHTAAKVIRSYAGDFSAAPPVVNLLEPAAPTRRELVERLKARRPDLRVIWMWGWVLRSISATLVFVQRVFLFKRQPLSVASAFVSPKYRTDVAARVISAATPAASAPTPRA